MVWLAGNDLVGAEELLEQHDAGELMRKRELPERKPPVGTLEYRAVQPKGATDDQPQIAPVAPALLDCCRQPLARERFALAVEGADVGIGRQALEDCGALPGAPLPRSG